MVMGTVPVIRITSAGSDSIPDDSYNQRRQLIETIAFATAQSTADAALMLFWLERMVIAARLHEYRTIFPRAAELNAQYLLFAKIFRAGSTEPPNVLMQQITQYLLDTGRGEVAIRHTQIGNQLVCGQIAITVRCKPLPPALVFRPGTSHR